MSQGWHFAKSVLVQTAWLTPVFITVNDLVVGPAWVNGRSMQPTLNPEGANWNDRILVDKLSTRLYKYARGDVVILRYVNLSVPVP